MSGKRAYFRLNVPCDLSHCSLGQAALVVGPAFVYTLFVHPTHELSAVYDLKRLAALTMENPLAPYVNLITDPQLERGEWVLEANGKSCGSEGVM